MDWNSKVEDVKNLCYQCEFQKVVLTVNDSMSLEPSGEHFFKLQLYKSQALFEMHRVHEAKDLLRKLTEHEEKQSDFYLYVMAKLHYADKDWEKAIRLFRLLADRSESIAEYFKAILGLANSYYSISKTMEVKKLLPELEELLDLVPLDQNLSLRLFQANVAHGIDHKTSLAKQIFKDVMAQSIPKQWNYFIIKSLFGLSVMYQDLGKSESLESTLDILQCYLNSDESTYLTYLVNERFKDNNIHLSSPLQFDHEFKRIAVQGKWIPLHDKPLIYNFLAELRAKDSFVSKEDIAGALWPEQEYRPRTHDPRIFDLARRIRNLVEPYENQPVCLLSGRFGYKLATKSIENDVNIIPRAPQAEFHRPVAH